MKGNQDELFIGVDGGTTVIKSVLFDTMGNELDVAQASVPIETPKPGYQEQDMLKVWRAVKQTIKELVDRHADVKQNIRSIGITAQGAGCWLINEKGQPVGNAILWSDARAADIVAEWGRQARSSAIYDICGSIQYSGCQSAIVNWLARNDADRLKSARHLLWCKDWIKFKLSGVVSTDPSDASVSFLNTARGQYDSRLLDLTDNAQYKHLLPKVQPVDQISGPILPDVAVDLGLPRDVMIVGGPFDLIATATGVGAVSNGQACSILGTALISEVVIDHYNSSPENVGFTLCHCVPKRWLRAMAGMLGTPNLDWFLEQFCHEDRIEAERNGQSVFEWIEPKLASLPTGSGGLIYHSYLSSAGERSPFVNENARAQFFGMCEEHSRHHMLRALYEGVVLAVKHAYDSIPGDIQNITLSGGGAQSPLWCQMIADAMNAEVRVPSGTEFGAKGAVINAMVALEYFEDHSTAVKEMVQFERSYSPDAGTYVQFQRLFQIYLKLYGNMVDAWDALAEFRRQA